MLIKAHYKSLVAEFDFDFDGGFEMLDILVRSCFDSLASFSESLTFLDVLGCDISPSFEDLTSLAAVSTSTQHPFLIFVIECTLMDSCSTIYFSESTEVIQPCYRVLDTQINMCSFCREYFDPSLILAENLQISKFRCQHDFAVSCGFMSKPNDDTSEERERVTSKADGHSATLFNTVVTQHRKRLLLTRAVNSLVSATESPQQQALQERFRQRLLSGCHTVNVYEDFSQQQSARNCVDFEKVQFHAAVYAEANPGCAEDVIFMKGLLKWFKNNFFKWCNKPKCSNQSCVHYAETEKCMEGIGMSQDPTEEEKKGGCGGRIELYRCKVCKLTTRFPRLNNPSYLLERTRTGRCGEWANAFGLVCRSLGMDVQYMLDFTDHVWIEVWIPSLERYVHVDACENSFDAPLTYEVGWKKQLSYVLGFSRFGAYDATSRYTKQYEVLVQRRGSGADANNPNPSTVLNERNASTAIEQMNISQWKHWQQLRVGSVPYSNSAVDVDTIKQMVENGQWWQMLQYQTSLLTNGSKSTSTSAVYQALYWATGDISVVEADRRKRSNMQELRKLCFRDEADRVLECMGVKSSGAQVSAEEVKGRISGDTAWKTARQEIGTTATTTPTVGCMESLVGASESAESSGASDGAHTGTGLQCTGGYSPGQLLAPLTQGLLFVDIFYDHHTTTASRSEAGAVSVCESVKELHTSGCRVQCSNTTTALASPRDGSTLLAINGVCVDVLPLSHGSSTISLSATSGAIESVQHHTHNADDDAAHSTGQGSIVLSTGARPDPSDSVVSNKSPHVCVCEVLQPFSARQYARKCRLSWQSPGWATKDTAEREKETTNRLRDTVTIAALKGAAASAWMCKIPIHILIGKHFVCPAVQDDTVACPCTPLCQDVLVDANAYVKQHDEALGYTAISKGSDCIVFFFGKESYPLELVDVAAAIMEGYVYQSSVKVLQEDMGVVGVTEQSVGEASAPSTSNNNSNSNNILSLTSECDAVYLDLGGCHHADTITFDTSFSIWNWLKFLPSLSSVYPMVNNSISVGVSKIEFWSDELVHGMKTTYVYVCGNMQWEIPSPTVMMDSYNPDCSLQHTVVDLNTPCAPAGAPMRIIGVECRSGALVDSITLFTSDGNCIKIGGSGGGNCNKVDVPPGWEFGGLYGGFGGHVHNVGVVLLKTRQGSQPGPALSQTNTMTVPLFGDNQSPDSTPSPLAVAPNGPHSLSIIQHQMWKMILARASCEQGTTRKECDIWNCGLLNDSTKGNINVLQPNIPKLIELAGALAVENSRDVFLQTVSAVITYLTNIQRDITNLSKRKIKVGNSFFNRTVLQAQHGLSFFCFGPAGFRASLATSTPSSSDVGAKGNWFDAVCALESVVCLPGEDCDESCGKVLVTRSDWISWLNIYIDLLQNVFMKL